MASIKNDKGIKNEKDKEIDPSVVASNNLSISSNKTKENQGRQEYAKHNESGDMDAEKSTNILKSNINSRKMDLKKEQENKKMDLKKSIEIVENIKNNEINNGEQIREVQNSKQMIQRELKNEQEDMNYDDEGNHIDYVQIIKNIVISVHNDKGNRKLSDVEISKFIDEDMKNDNGNGSEILKDYLSKFTEEDIRNKVRADCRARASRCEINKNITVSVNNDDKENKKQLPDYISKITEEDMKNDGRAEYRAKPSRFGINKNRTVSVNNKENTNDKNILKDYISNITEEDMKNDGRAEYRAKPSICGINKMVNCNTPSSSDESTELLKNINKIISCENKKRIDCEKETKTLEVNRQPINLCEQLKTHRLLLGILQNPKACVNNNIRNLIISNNHISFIKKYLHEGCNRHHSEEKPHHYVLKEKSLKTQQDKLLDEEKKQYDIIIENIKKNNILSKYSPSDINYVGEYALTSDRTFQIIWGVLCIPLVIRIIKTFPVLHWNDIALHNDLWIVIEDILTCPTKKCIAQDVIQHLLIGKNC